jgi:hypothetical protein
MTYLMSACNRHLNMSFSTFIELYLSCITCLKVPTNALGIMNVILLNGNHRHGPATHVVVIRAMSTRIQMQL